MLYEPGPLTLIPEDQFPRPPIVRHDFESLAAAATLELRGAESALLEHQSTIGDALTPSDGLLVADDLTRISAEVSAQVHASDEGLASAAAALDPVDAEVAHLVGDLPHPDQYGAPPEEPGPPEGAPPPGSGESEQRPGGGLPGSPNRPPPAFPPGGGSGGDGGAGSGTAPGAGGGAGDGGDGGSGGRPGDDGPPSV